MNQLDDNGSIIEPYQNFIALSKYARWLDDEERRETWSETINRYFDFMLKHLETKFHYSPDEGIVAEMKNEVLSLNLMPSMRALMTAGPALERENLAGFNCSFIAVDSPRAFDEALYILMNGTGLGFSVEKKYLIKLPVIADEFFETNTTIVVEDSKLGWAKALKELVTLLYAGQVPTWDVSKVRPAGARLKTFGGRASGPEPLVEVFEFFVKTFKSAAGRQLRSLEAHDLMCKIAQIVVVGGVRRSALISISDPDDYDMAKAKTGNFWEENNQRYLANNSAAWEGKPSLGNFMSEWLNLYESNSGERGIINMDGAKRHIRAQSANRPVPRDETKIQGLNPCAEILLRSAGLCNLSEVVIRPEDSVEVVKRRVELATILGTWQATLTNFKYVRKIWQKNAEEERLLGVSLTGIFDNPIFSGSRGLASLGDILDDLKGHAIKINYKESRLLGVKPSAAITCVKPSGTVSQLVDCASGIHPRFSNKYIRTVRASNNDPLTQFMKDAGVPNEPDFANPERSTVFSFPIDAGANALTRNHLSAVDHLDIWRTYKMHWTEHNPSVTIQVREEEWFEVADWVYKHFDDICGVSFLPHSDHVYKQAPYQDCTEEEWQALKEKMPVLDWSMLSYYESTDAALKGSQELACSASTGCEVVDISTTEVKG